MSDELVKVKLVRNYPRQKWNGICGFYIQKGEVKRCPQDVAEDGVNKGALELVDKPKVPQKQPEKKEDEKADLNKAGEETKDLLNKVKDRVTGSGKKSKK